MPGHRVGELEPADRLGHRMRHVVERRALLGVAGDIDHRHLAQRVADRSDRARSRAFAQVAIGGDQVRSMSQRGAERLLLGLGEVDAVGTELGEETFDIRRD